jgi:hypothetical protein
MHRRAAPFLALAPALLAACTPTGERPPGEDWEPSSLGWRRPAEADPDGPDPDRGDPTCGAIAVEPVGPWEREGVQLDDVRKGWRPRAEYGVPIAIREARSPVAMAGYRLWQVEVQGAPQAIQPCLLRDEGPDREMGIDGCVPAWRIFYQSTPEARPQTHGQWAQLLGVLDGASAVYPDVASLDHCMKDLPAQVRATVPPLGLHHAGSTTQAVFVERVDAGTELALLVIVRATLEDDRLEVERQELWTMDREVGR